MYPLPLREKPIFHSIREFDLMSLIGSGAFSQVFSAVHRESKYNYAIKMVDYSKISEIDQENIQKEVQAHKLMNHKNIVSLFDYFKEDNVVYFIMELCQKDNLFRFIHEKKLDEKEKQKVFKQACDAVNYVNRKGFVIRDIKPENILLDEYKNAKLCDFGWTAHINDKEYCKVKAGTLSYMSPESLMGITQTISSDAWSLGILLYEIYHDREPYVASSISQMLNMISKGDIVFDDSLIPKEAKQLVKDLLVEDTRKRLSLEKIYETDYLKDYNQEQSLRDIKFMKRQESVNKYFEKPQHDFTNTNYEINGSSKNNKETVKQKYTTNPNRNNGFAFPITAKSNIPLVQKGNGKMYIKAHKETKKNPYESKTKPSVRRLEFRGEKELRNLVGRVNKKNSKDTPSFFGGVNLFADQKKINFSRSNSFVPKKNKSNKIALPKPIDLGLFRKAKTQDYSSNIGVNRINNIKQRQEPFASQRSKTPTKFHFYGTRNYNAKNTQVPKAYLSNNLV